MKIRHLITTSAALVSVAAVALGPTADARDGGRITSDALVSVPATMTGPAGNIRGINGGGLPWSIGAAEVSLKAGGKLEVAFQDLVFAAGPNVGKNTVASMAVTVSCLNSANQPVNVATAPFPVTVGAAADGGGDGSVEARVSLPSPCFAPVVLVTNAAGTAWFAVDGI